jgi:hypothetical protein
VQIQIRNGTAAQWTSANPVLAAGEVGIENDTRKQKFGDGTTAWNSLAYAGGGTVTSVGATSPVASSGGATPTISLNAGYGDTLNPYVSKTANQVLAAPNGTSGVPSFRALVSADIPTLNQNTTGTAAGLSSTLAVASGGTGQTTAISAFNALAPSQSGNSGKYLTTNGTNTSWATVSSGGGPAGSDTQIQWNNAGVLAGAISYTTDGSSYFQIGNASRLQFSDNDNSNFVALKSPVTVASNVVWTLPGADGSSGQVLSTNGSGTLSWATASGGGTPSNPANSIQFNNGGAFGGSANLTWDGTNVQLGAAGALRLADSDSSNYASFQSPATLAANTAYTLPTALPTASGSSLQCTTAGVMSWGSAAPTAPPTVEYLVVAGGGGGGADLFIGRDGGGGGAGGYLTATGYAVTAGTPITVTVGGGGAGGSSSTTGNNGVNGTPSVFGSISTVGGGGGQGHVATPPLTVPGVGGSGGGARNGSTGGAGTAGQGFAGGNGNADTSPFTAGGGGGAAAVGGNAVTSVAGNGGAGLDWNSLGTFYAGGGGGSASSGGTAGSGGSSIGGAGAVEPSAGNNASPANRGSGGGGGVTTGGSGSSGIVIVRYADTYTAAASSTGSPTITTSGGYRYYTWTGSGSITF